MSTKPWNDDEDNKLIAAVGRLGATDKTELERVMKRRCRAALVTSVGWLTLCPPPPHSPGARSESARWGGAPSPPASPFLGLVSQLGGVARPLPLPLPSFALLAPFTQRGVARSIPAPRSWASVQARITKLQGKGLLPGGGAAHDGGKGGGAPPKSSGAGAQSSGGGGPAAEGGKKPAKGADKRADSGKQPGKRARAEEKTQEKVPILTKTEAKALKGKKIQIYWDGAYGGQRAPAIPVGRRPPATAPRRKPATPRMLAWIAGRVPAA